jgi:two-component system sensor histidine kinase/response regulator
MKLRKLSVWFSVGGLLILGANMLGMTLVEQAYTRMMDAQAHRQQSIQLSSELQQETEQLARLVRAYTTTGESRYLFYYYDILAVRLGEKPAPVTRNPATYWEDVIAGRIQHVLLRQGVRQTLPERMRALGFGREEFKSLTRVFAATEAMKRIEQIAFAATQGLYDINQQAFVSEGRPNLAYASKLVYSQRYNTLIANLAHAVDDLQERVNTRTQGEVERASVRLQQLIMLMLASMALTIALLGLVFVTMRRQVLQPIEALKLTADRLSAGDYTTRTRQCLARGAGVKELAVLGATLDSMAQAIETDIHHREAVQKEVETARNQAEQATRAKSMFLANMSHEIRTPMNAIIGMTYLVLKTELGARQRDYLSKVHTAAAMLLGIINDILDFSKIEAGKLELEHSPFVLEDAVGNALTLLQQRAAEKEIELLLDIRDARLLGSGGALLGDALRLGQILINLLSNAIKFTQRGHVKLTVDIDRHDSASFTLCFCVSDTGIGMTAEQLQGLFQEFTQVDSSTTRKYGGTGLGLTIAKRLVELMGGHICVESTPDAGSHFTFSARFALAQPRPAGGATLPGVQALRTLVVDDQDEACTVLATMLQQLGVGQALPSGIDRARSGDAALAMIVAAMQQGRPYQLLMLDWVMPGMDGEALLQKLHATNPETAPVTVIVSAYDADVMHNAASLQHARRFLSKPVLPEALRQLLNGLTGQTPILAPIEPLMPAPPPTAPQTDTAHRRIPFGWPPCLPRFKLLLVECNAEAIELWETSKPDFNRVLPLQTVHRISVALDNFDFDVALALLPKD